MEQIKSEPHWSSHFDDDKQEIVRGLAAYTDMGFFALFVRQLHQRIKIEFPDWKYEHTVGVIADLIMMACDEVGNEVGRTTH